jgi:DnaJ family protein C protein 3
LAREWHPDKFIDPADKETASKKFMDIASAKEVLTDPEKRRQFDQGIDPLDAQEQSQRNQQQQHHGFNPFQGFGGGGGGGGGGGQQFHFKFQ